MPYVLPYADALASLREVLSFYAGQPTFLPRSIELESAAQAAAHAALRNGVALATLSADLGRLAAEALPNEPNAAVAAGRAMARWAARAFDEAGGVAMFVGAR